MRKSKLLALAAGLFLAAGITTAGTYYVDGVQQGSFTDVQINGNGTVFIKTDTSTTPTCATGEVYDSQLGACRQQCASGETYDYQTNQCEADTSGGTNDGGSTGGSTTVDCSGVPQSGTRGGSLTAFSDFPSPTGTKHNFTIETDDYMAVQFTAPPSGDAGYLATATDSHATNALHAMAISRCPGDFSVELANGVCKKESSSHTFWWSTFGQYSSSTCELTPGETYFLNVKYAKLSSLSVSTCSSFKCGAKLAFVDY